MACLEYYNDYVIAMTILGFNMTRSCDYDLVVMNIVIASIIMLILTWLGYSLDYYLDYAIAMIMPWIILQ